MSAEWRHCREATGRSAVRYRQSPRPSERLESLLVRRVNHYRRQTFCDPGKDIAYASTPADPAPRAHLAIPGDNAAQSVAPRGAEFYKLLAHVTQLEVPGCSQPISTPARARVSPYAAKPTRHPTHIRSPQISVAKFLHYTTGRSNRRWVFSASAAWCSH